MEPVMNSPSVVLCRVAILILPAASVLAIGCNRKETSSQGSAQRSQQEPAAQTPAPVHAEDASIVAPEDEAAEKNKEGKPRALELPIRFEQQTGDFEEMMKRRKIRALITINPLSFFYVHGRPAGLAFEAMQELERF